jgi:2-iminobutanoate/2-iminopropanoate deaminase
MHTVITSNDAPKPIGPYSQAIRAGNMLFISGQIGIDPKTGALIRTSLEAETIAALDNVMAVLKAAGFGPTHVVKTTLYLGNLDDFSVINAIYGLYFSSHKPARACVEVARLPKNARVDIEAVAVID